MCNFLGEATGAFMKKLLLGGVALLAFAGSAIAADIPAPVYKAAPATVVSASGWYLSVDGSWERINLPTYALGFRGINQPAPNIDLGISHPFTQRFDGYGIRGTVGYILPPGTLFGTNTRVELGGHYRHASGTQVAGSDIAPAATIVYLNGSGINQAFNCLAPALTCPTTSTQSTNFSEWQLHGRVAGDVRTGSVVLTPSLAVFGGIARNNQTLAQNITQLPGGITASYAASTSTRWDDIGARAGLAVRFEVSTALTLDLSGYAGFARRHASLAGSDVGTGFTAGASTLSVTANATPFIANGEAGLAYKWTPAFIIRGFAGLNYDSKVPGIVSPSFTGSILAPTSRTAASISFQSETSYYAGGGVTWAFGL